MNKKLLSPLALAAILSVSLPQAALADGSTWGSLENSPAEDNNVIGMVYAEKSVPVWQKDQLKLSPFISGTLVFDSKGYSWNNKAAAKAGGKLDYQVGPNGSLTLRVGAAFEHLFKSGDSYTEPFASAEYWFGWGSGTSAPGSSWGSVGNTSPSEKGNVIAMAHVEQGFLARNMGKGTMVPFVDLTVSRDTKDFDWNNKEALGLGVKYVHPIGEGSVNVGVKYQSEDGANGLVGFVSFWAPF